jgi:hypothetical protein
MCRCKFTFPRHTRDCGAKYIREGTRGGLGQVRHGTVKPSLGLTRQASSHRTFPTQTSSQLSLQTTYPKQAPFRPFRTICHLTSPHSSATRLCAPRMPRPIPQVCSPPYTANAKPSTQKRNYPRSKQHCTNEEESATGLHTALLQQVPKPSMRYPIQPTCDNTFLPHSPTPPHSTLNNKESHKLPPPPHSNTSNNTPSSAS